MSGLGKETSKQTLRERLLSSNKLLIGSAAVLLITSFAFGGTVINISHGKSENYSPSNTINSMENDNAAAKNTNNPNINNSSSMSEEEQIMANTTCNELSQMSNKDANKFDEDLYDAGFRRTVSAENEGDEFVNMTTSIYRGCEKNPTAKVGDFVSIQTSEYKGEYR